LKKLLHEIHRRSIWQVLGIYLAGSWIALQVVDTVNSTVGLPDWFPGAAFALLAIGLPIVLSTAVVQGGFKPSTGPDASAPGGDVPSPGVGSAPAPASAQAVPVAPASTAVGSGAGGLLTWRRALVGGVGAFAVLGVVTVGYFVSRATGIGPAGTLVAQGLLEEQPRILLTQFASSGADTLLARTATEALRTDLAESPVVTLAEPVFVRDALQRMERSPTTPLDQETGRELAQREGIGALVAGELSAVGDGYAISGQIVDVESGAALFSHRETAKDANGVLPAIDRLSKKLRERIGESLRSVRADAPRERVTTSSFEAFQKYSLALYADEVEGDDEKAQLLLEEAIRADSTFGMAYLRLGELSGKRSVDVAMTDRAYALRDAMSDRERYYTIASYHWHRGEWDRAIAALESILAEHPDDGSTLTWISSLYIRHGDVERALDAARRAVAAPTCGFCSFQALARAQVAKGNFDEAARTADDAAARLPAHPGTHWLKSVVMAARRDYAGAAANLDSAVTDIPEMATNINTADLGAALDGIRGRLGDMDRRVEDWLLGHEDAEAGDRIWLASMRANYESQVRGDTARALRVIRDAESDGNLQTLDPLDRPYLDLARAYAAAGDAPSARRLLSERKSQVPEEFQRYNATDARAGEAETLVAEGDYDAALETARLLPDIECWRCLIEARALDLSGRADEAIVAYEKYLETPFLFDIYPSQWVLAGTYERLAHLYDERGDGQSAVKYYAAFVELWADADTDLQPRVRAAQDRLEAIMREIG